MSASGVRGRSPIAVIGWGIHLPDADLGSIGIRTGEPACPSERAQELLGSKGLLYKEPATRLALCAVHRALGLAPRASRSQSVPSPRVAVVASSNLGNAATVQSIVRTVRTTGLKDVSALDAPNASSNVVATTVAMWFRFGGPNLMVCSGATSGMDAVSLGCVLLQTRRADRVVVVGAEPDDEVSAALHARRRALLRGERLRAGAACVVLERSDADRACTPLLGPVGLGAPPRWAGWPPVVIGPKSLAHDATSVIDVTAAVGDFYGAAGVLQIAMAAALAEQSHETKPWSVAVICGDDADGFRWTTVTAGANTGAAMVAAKEIAG